MNSPSDGRTPGSRPPLRVYLSGDADPHWRMDLIRPEAHEAYAVAVQRNAGDTVLTDSLPYGHTFVGPFQIRAHLSREDLVPNNVHEFSRGQHLSNTERWRMRAIAKADIIFTWLTHSDGPAERDAGVEVGLAYGTGKAVILAASSALALERAPLLTEMAWKMIVAPTARQAYERITADLDVTFERGMARIEAKYDGRCVVCRSAYKTGETIYWSKPKGAMHVDCYTLVNSPEEMANVAFNSELVRALRAENADLEKECLNLMTKNSMLEQKKQQLESEREELYREYLKVTEGR